MQTNYDFNGRHVIADLYHLEGPILNDIKILKTLILKGVSKSRATVISDLHFQFSPMGITILLLLAESHVSLHTYPTQQAAFFDSFTCGEECNPEVILEEFCKGFQQCKVRKTVMIRGDVA